MADTLFPEFTPAPDEPDLPLQSAPRYVESGGGLERWPSPAQTCAVCQEEIVHALTPAGELLELAVRVKTWRIRLNPKQERLHG